MAEFLQSILILLFGFIYLTIINATAINSAHTNNDIPMIIFIIFVYCGTLLLFYCFRLYHSLSRRGESARKHNLKSRAVALLIFIMLGFACQFSTFMSPVQFLAFFAVVIAGSSVLYYVHVIWDVPSNVSSGTPMENDPEIGPSPLPLTNSNAETKIYCVGSFFAFINIPIISAFAIYLAHNNGDIPMVLFINFIYFGTVLLDYWFRLYYSLPRHEQSARNKLKIEILVLLIFIMFGFLCEFSVLMKPGESRAIPSVVIGGSSLLLYVYFIWKCVEDKICEKIWSNSNTEGEENEVPLGDMV